MIRGPEPRRESPCTDEVFAAVRGDGTFATQAAASRGFIPLINFIGKRGRT
jgi:hypothetical protein